MLSVPPATIPNTPSFASVGPPPDGTTTKLTVTWPALAIDGSQSAATGYNVRTSLSGAWTMVTNVTSPYAVTGLTSATDFDAEVQGSNVAGSGAWSGVTTAATWGAPLPRRTGSQPPPRPKVPV